jgi:ubiquinone/menaquinone biosynthesis C-methylase UbiE
MKLDIKFSDLNNGDYHGYYHRDERAYKEDEEIAKYMERVLRAGDEVVDLGCGDGLGKRLIDRLSIGRTITYIGVDPDNEFIDPETGKPFNPDYNLTADEFLEKREISDAVILLFSAEQCGWKATIKAWDQAQRGLMVFANRLTDFGHSKLYNWLYTVCKVRFQTRKIKRELEKRGFEAEKLLGEDTYYVAWKTGRSEVEEA